MTFKIIGSSVHVDARHCWASVQFSDQLGGHTIKVVLPLTKQKMLSAVRDLYADIKAKAVVVEQIKQSIAQYIDQDTTVSEKG